ncbi:hypothetical protein [Rhodococcus sp. YH1]|uniref:hypothetical protein n=1 Tax=Rhodococcus sp. YH1 TaxID=89066 RepID=UPI0013866BD0|nr:hypothetical protein [Rhodococcus sp. YH1]NCL78914.1 hypothetical protein [Rhodococcus sp. YH1]
MPETRSAAQRLAALEERILAGETVAPAELAAARAALEVEQLADTGRARRAEAAALAAAYERREKAKRDAIALRRESVELGKAAAAFAQAKAAIQRMNEHLAEYGAARDQAIRGLLDAKVPAGEWGVNPKAWGPEIDRKNHVVIGHGGTVGAVVVDGEPWGEETPRGWLSILLAQVDCGVQLEGGPARDSWPHVLRDLDGPQAA